MIIPIGDINPRKSTPFVNYLLIAANVVVYALVVQKPQPQINEIYNAHGLIPRAWEWQDLFTSMFLHGDLWHLVFNMLFLWIAGDNVEDRLGHAGYVVFYALAGVAGSAAHIATAWGGMMDIPTVGASGAISGVLGAYLVFFPRSKIKFALLLVIFIRFFTLPSWGAIGLWAASQVAMAVAQVEGKTTMVAIFAHLGGFVLGLGVAILLRLIGRAKPAKS